ncbi:SIS domain-containing protein [Thermodesulfobacteriota bacterium]
MDEHLACLESLRELEPVILEAANLILQAISHGDKVLICGNGGSAADAQHFAAELVGRFQRERRSLPALALTTDTSILSAWANDYSFDTVFARQIEGLGRPGDVLVAISTSGRSRNVSLAARTASSSGMRSIGLLGRDGGEIKGEVDVAVIVPNDNTARIQEAHEFILHLWADIVERSVST